MPVAGLLTGSVQQVMLSSCSEGRRSGRAVASGENPRGSARSNQPPRRTFLHQASRDKVPQAQRPADGQDRQTARRRSNCFRRVETQHSPQRRTAPVAKHTVRSCFRKRPLHAPVSIAAANQYFGRRADVTFHAMRRFHASTCDLLCSTVPTANRRTA